MKKTLILTLITISILSLTSCSKENANSSVSANSKETKVIKNEASQLPATIFYKTGADINNLKTIVSRKIESVTWENPTAENQVKINELYPNYITSQLTDLENEYQLIKVVVVKENSFSEDYDPSDYDKEQLPAKGEYALVKKTTLVLGKENISTKYPIINSQISQLSDPQAMSSYQNNNGIFYIAVPLEIYEKNKDDLQLEIFPSVEDELQTSIYIDID